MDDMKRNNKDIGYYYITINNVIVNKFSFLYIKFYTYIESSVYVKCRHMLVALLLISHNKVETQLASLHLVFNCPPKC